jgi:hypothetical protein
LDRQIVFPGSVPLDTDILSVQRNTMAALGYLTQATLGQGPVADGLVCAPTAPASMSVAVGPGSLAALTVLDTLAFGSLAADATTPLMKMGVNLQPVTFPLTAPTGSGESINYLVQAAFSESDATPVVLPYYNAANPTQPFSGPNNSGVAQDTQRLQRVQLQLKPGAPAPAGTQLTPPVDAGWVGLWGITVDYGQTSVTAPNIWMYPNAPFLPFKLPQLTPGFSRLAVFGLAGITNWTVPLGVAQARIRVLGAGGGGGGGNTSWSGGGGGAGGYAEAVVGLTSGQTLPVTVGAGGAGSAAGSSGAGGGTSSVGTLISATGGQGGGSISPNSYGGIGGVGFGGAIILAGGNGADGHSSVSYFGGQGGASLFGGGGRGGSGGGMNGAAPGSGGGGAYNSSGSGGNGANGLVVIEY